MKNTKIYIYIFFLFIIFIGSIYSFSISNNLSIISSFSQIFEKNIETSKIGFFYGELLINFFETNNFLVYIDNIELYLVRPLFIPYLLVFLHKVTSLEFFIIFLKNIFLFSIYYYSVINYFKSEEFNKFRFILFLIVPYLLPYNAYQALQLVPEESYLIFIIPAIFLCILSKKNNIFFITILMSICLFTKSPNIIIVSAILILIFFKNFNIQHKKILILTMLILSMTWCFYAYNKSKVMALFHKSYTVNSLTGLQSHNVFFKYFYPKYSVDNILPYFDFFYDKIEVKNEKNFAETLNSEIKDYIYKDLPGYLKQKLIIIYHTIFNIRIDGQHFTQNCLNSFNKIIERMKADKRYYNLDEDEKLMMTNCKTAKIDKIRFEFIINKIIWLASLIIAFLNIIIFKRNFKCSFLLIYFNIFYLLPYIYGHIYTRHQIVLFALSFIFMIINYNLKSIRK